MNTKVEQWCEHHYPSFIRLSEATSAAAPKQMFNKADPRTRIVGLEQKLDDALALKRRREDTRNGTANGGAEERAAIDTSLPFETVMYAVAGFTVCVVTSLATIYAINSIVN